MSNHFDLATHYFLRREYALAAHEYREALGDDPTDARTWSFYGICLAHVGRASEAEAALARAISISPNNGETWFHLGVARSLREEWDEAASAYRRAVALEPDDLVAWHRLGVALAESGEETAASVAFERALVLSREVADEPRAERAPRPPPADDHTDEGGQKEGAREAKSWLELAMSLLSLGDEEEALAAFERAETLDPDRARRSLFPPMLKLLTAISDHPAAPAPSDGRPAPPRPQRPVGPSEIGLLDDRPEVG